MNKFLKVAVATATVFAVQDVCTATPVNSCSKSGFYLSAALKGKRQQSTFKLKDGSKTVADRLLSILIELVTKEEAKFGTANEAVISAGAATGIFQTQVNGGPYGAAVTGAADSDLIKEFPAIGKILHLAGTNNNSNAQGDAVAANAVNAMSIFGNTSLQFENNTNDLFVIAVADQNIATQIVTALKDGTKFKTFLTQARANLGKNYATDPTVKCEYTDGKKWSFGAEFSVGYSVRINDFVVNIGGIADFMFAGNKVSCTDTGLESANDNSNNNNKNNNNSKNDTNDYGIDVIQKPSFGGEVEIMYNCTRKFSLGAGCDLCYKRYEVITNKMSDLFVFKDGIFYGDLVKACGGNLDSYNKDMLATGIAEKSVKANGWVVAPYIKLKFDFNQHVGMFTKFGYDINKSILKEDSSFGTLKVGGFHASLGVNVVF